ncbi:MAG: zinc dependent phospholipase C family protein [Gammaproteobacteria bacterium]|nr:zinc dependent phospholipase C family protein [Gammaproteobacteria bacterium]
MQTYSHLLLAGATGAALSRRRRVAQGWFCFGAVAPDLPFYLVAAVWFGALWLAEPESLGHLTYGASFDWHYFHDPLWIAAYNVLHAPLDLLALAGLARWAVVRSKSWGRPLAWFIAGAASHVVMDLLTHHGDGPLLLFPFDWRLRWAAPVSYWNPRWHGIEFHHVEMAADVVWGASWLKLALSRRFARAPAGVPVVAEVPDAET